MSVSARASRLRTKFGITEAQFEAILELQGGVCGICMRPQSHFRKHLCVDHDHRGGTIRGLLCEPDNYKLGFVKDNAVWLQAAADYLRGRYATGIARILGANHRIPPRVKLEGWGDEL